MFRSLCGGYLPKYLITQCSKDSSNPKYTNIKTTYFTLHETSFFKTSYPSAPFIVILDNVFTQAEYIHIQSCTTASLMACGRVMMEHGIADELSSGMRRCPSYLSTKFSFG